MRQVELRTCQLLIAITSEQVSWNFVNFWARSSSWAACYLALSTCLSPLYPKIARKGSPTFLKIAAASGSAPVLMSEDFNSPASNIYGIQHLAHSGLDFWSVGNLMQRVPAAKIPANASSRMITWLLNFRILPRGHLGPAKSSLSMYDLSSSIRVIGDEAGQWKRSSCFIPLERLQRPQQWYGDPCGTRAKSCAYFIAWNVFEAFPKGCQTHLAKYGNMFSHIVWEFCHTLRVDGLRVMAVK